ncbi:MAG: glycosyltransferase [Actinomycetota bacterium]|nr:glycosyltransferase [Actinomycetota bacterium]
MKVVHFGLADLHPGAHLAGYSIHSALNAIGIESFMVVLYKKSEDASVIAPAAKVGRWLARRTTALEFLPKRFINGIPWLFSPMQPETSLGWVGSGSIRKVARLQPDIVQLHWIAGGLVRPESLKKLARFPLVWRLSDMWPFTGTRHYEWEDRRYIEGYDQAPRLDGRGPDIDRWVWKRKREAYAALPDLTLVAPSTWMARAAASSALFRDRRVEVIHTGVDTHHFSPRDKTRARRRLGWDPDAAVVLFGAVAPGANPRKGFNELAHALEGLSSAGSRFHFVVFGGDAAVEASVSVQRLGRLDRDRLPDVYSAADVFVAPSLQENLANTVLEALACGTPVVAFDVGGMSDAVLHRQNGFLARASDPTDLGRGIRWVLDASEESRRELSRTARSQIVQRFDRKAKAGSYIALYEDLLERRAALPPQG